MFSLLFPCPTANFPCANLQDLWLLDTQNWLGRLIKLKKNNWDFRGTFRQIYNLSKPNSLCFGKISKFLVFFLTYHFLLLTFSLFSLCRGYPAAMRFYRFSLICIYVQDLKGTYHVRRPDIFSLYPPQLEELFPRYVTKRSSLSNGFLDHRQTSNFWIADRRMRYHETRITDLSVGKLTESAVPIMKMMCDKIDQQE